MSAGAPVAVAEAQEIRLERASFASASEHFLSSWKAFDAHTTPEVPLQDPQWLQGYFKEELDKITSYLLRDQTGSVCGSASFVLKDWPMKLHLGEVPIRELPLKRLRYLGGSTQLPQDQSVYNLLFRELIATSGYDALYFAQLPVDSFLWKYLTTSPLVSKEFYLYKSEDPTLHPMLRFGTSFDEYMKTNFSATHRYTLRRKITRFQEKTGGAVKLVRYTRPEEVASFLEEAVKISRKTYQWNLHQRGLRATERFQRRYRFAAENGWFRSYLLFSGETPCAFLGGYQWRGRYYIDELGFDPAFTKHSPGTVMQLLAIQDMFTYEPVQFIDFGSYDKYKEELSTESYKQCDIMLLRRRPYCRFVQGAHYACRLTTKAAVNVLGRLNLKSRFKKKVRDRSVSSNEGDGKRS